MRNLDGNTIAAGNSYSIMKQTDNFGQTSELLFRKNNPDYFEYAKTDNYTSAFQYSISEFTDHLFLNQYVQQNNSWESPEFKDTTTFNQVIYLKYLYRCVKSNSVATVNGKVFANVCIIEMRPQLRAIGNPWGPTNEVYTYYYAKGIGLIYYKAINNMGYRKAEMQVNSWSIK